MAVTGASPQPFDRRGRLADQIATALIARTLPKAEWTHDAHVLACASLVRRLGPAEALAVLRVLIPAYNEATGVANTTTGGYHDTITAYYVWAVARLIDDGLDTRAVLDHPLVERTALLLWWDRATVTSPAARARWVAPTAPSEGRQVPIEWVPAASGATRTAELTSSEEG